MYIRRTGTLQSVSRHQTCDKDIVGFCQAHLAWSSISRDLVFLRPQRNHCAIFSAAVRISISSLKKISASIGSTMQPDDTVLIQIAGRWVGGSGLDSQKEGNTRREDPRPRRKKDAWIRSENGALAKNFFKLQTCHLHPSKHIYLKPI